MNFPFQHDYVNSFSIKMILQLNVWSFMHYEFLFIHLWTYVIVFLKRLKKSGREIGI